MTAVAADPRPTIDISQTEQVPFSRLVSTELRKMYDTRAGFWLLAATAGILVLFGAVTLLVTVLNDIDVSANLMIQIMVIPVGLLLPVLAITGVTSEWSQRTALVTFALEPHRMRVIAAKFVTVLLLALATMAIAFIVGALTNVLYAAFSGQSAEWSLSGRGLSWTVVSQILFFVMAFAFGLALLNSPAAIAIYYVVALILPFMVYGPIYGIFDWGQDIVPWLDLGFAVGPLADGASTNIEGKVYAQVALTTFVWVLLPLAFGLRRVSRTELK